MCDHALLLQVACFQSHAKNLDKTFTSISPPQQDLRAKAPSTLDPIPQPRVIHVGWWRGQPWEPPLSLPSSTLCLPPFLPSSLHSSCTSLPLQFFFHAFRTDFARIELGSGGRLSNWILGDGCVRVFDLRGAVDGGSGRAVGEVLPNRAAGVTLLKPFCGGVVGWNPVPACSVARCSLRHQNQGQSSTVKERKGKGEMQLVGFWCSCFGTGWWVFCSSFGRLGFR